MCQLHPLQSVDLYRLSVKSREEWVAIADILAETHAHALRIVTDAISSARFNKPIRLRKLRRKAKVAEIRLLRPHNPAM